MIRRDPERADLDRIAQAGQSHGPAIVAAKPWNSVWQAG